jgi:hypothetical protein
VADIAANPSPPIVANASPVQEQFAAGFRYTVVFLAAVATALGATKYAGEISAFLVVAGPFAALAAFIVGQIKTRQTSQDKAAMASLLPDSIAVVKK